MLHSANAGGQTFETRLQSARPWDQLLHQAFPTLSILSLPDRPGLFLGDQQGRLLHLAPGGTPRVLLEGISARVGVRLLTLWNEPHLVGIQGNPVIALSGHRNGVVLVCAADGSVVHHLLEGTEIRRVSVHPHEPILVAVLDNDSLSWWHWKKGRKIRRTPASNYPVTQTLFSLVGSRFFASRADGAVLVDDPDNGRELLSLPTHRGACIGLAMDETGRIPYTSGTDGEVRAWSGR